MGSLGVDSASPSFEWALVVSKRKWFSLPNFFLAPSPPSHEKVLGGWGFNEVEKRLRVRNLLRQWKVLWGLHAKKIGEEEVTYPLSHTHPRARARTHARAEGQIW